MKISKEELKNLVQEEIQKIISENLLNEAKDVSDQEYMELTMASTEGDNEEFLRLWGIYGDPNEYVQDERMKYMLNQGIEAKLLDSEGRPTALGAGADPLAVRGLGAEKKSSRTIRKATYTIEDLRSGKAVARMGDRGGIVKTLQNMLLTVGEKLPKYGTDGDFGGETKAAVISYQKKNNLSPDGVIGKNTFAKLFSEIGAMPDIDADGTDKLTAGEVPGEEGSRALPGPESLFNKATFVPILKRVITADIADEQVASIHAELLYNVLVGSDPADEAAFTFWNEIDVGERDRYLNTAVVMAKMPAEFPNPEDVTDIVRGNQSWEDEFLEDQATWEAPKESLEESSSQDGSILNERWQRLAGIDVL